MLVVLRNFVNSLRYIEKFETVQNYIFYLRNSFSDIFTFFPTSCKQETMATPLIYPAISEVRLREAYKASQ